MADPTHCVRCGGQGPRKTALRAAQKGGELRVCRTDLMLDLSQLVALESV
jgi:hypothetical protein